MIITGLELKTKKGHENCGAIDTDLFEYEETAKGSSATRIPSPDEIQEQEKQVRISELKELITNKNYLGDDVTAERNELRTLLGL